MNDMFGTTSQSFILKTIKKQNTYVLVIIFFYEIAHSKSTKCFRVLRCVNYTIIDHYFYIGNLACQSNNLSDICIDNNNKKGETF